MKRECLYKERCPYLGYEKPEKVLVERNYLRDKVDKMNVTFNLAIENIKLLKKEIAGLKEENAALKAEEKEEREKIYKPEKKERKQGRPGAPKGHRGITRRKPTKSDTIVKVRLKQCPHCGGRIKKVHGKSCFSDHIQEDIVILIKTTLFRHYKYWCGKCKKVVSGIGEGEIPRSYLGPTATIISNLFHYDIGTPYEKIERIYTDIFELPITTGALIGMDKRVAKKGIILYTELEKKIKQSSVSYTDETGWRINGENHWLWHAGNKDVGSLYVIDKHRNHDVAEKLLGENYKGILVSDCLATYNVVKASAKQKCIAHLLRDINKLDVLYPNDSEVIAFSVNLGNIICEGLDLKKEYKKEKCTIDDLEKGKEILEKKLDALTKVKIGNKKADTLRKRLIRHRNELFTFLVSPEVEPTNNFAERQLRPSVISRKLSFGNKTKAGADRHAIMMSLIQTAKLQGENPKDLLISLVSSSSKIRAPTS